MSASEASRADDAILGIESRDKAEGYQAADPIPLDLSVKGLTSKTYDAIYSLKNQARQSPFCNSASQNVTGLK